MLEPQRLISDFGRGVHSAFYSVAAGVSPVIVLATMVAEFSPLLQFLREEFTENQSVGPRDANVSVHAGSTAVLPAQGRPAR